jgi:hypothetical protein
VRFEFESGIVLFCFSFIFVLLGESRLLISWWAGGRCGMACNDEDRDKSRRPAAEDCEWSGGAMCDLHLVRGDYERGFLG